MRKKAIFSLIIAVSLIFVVFGGCFAETMSEGIKVVPEKETIYANEEGMWMYTLKLSSDTEGPVTVNSYVSKYFTMNGKYGTHSTADEEQLKEWGVHKLYPNKTKTFRGGFPSKNDIYFEDYIFIGTDKAGNEVMGAARVHFVKPERDKGVGPFD